MQLTLFAIYRGDKLYGEMDSIATADAIRGSVEFISAAAKIAYGSDVIGRGRVQAFNESSFEIQQLFEFIRDSTGLVATAFPLLPTIDNLASLVSLLKNGFDLLKHLGGEKPKKIFYAENGSVSVENNAGTINVYNQKTVNFILHTDASKSSQKFVGNPIAGEADEVELKLGKEIVLSASKKEAACFRDVTAGLTELVARQEVLLRVVSPVLEGQAQWKFHDGGRSFPAKVEDTAFLKRVDDGVETFTSGDRIRARLRTEQFLGPRRGLKMKYFVEEVLGRSQPTHTPELPFSRS